MTVPLKTRVLLADDHEVVRERPAAWCSTPSPTSRSSAEAGDGAEAVERALADDVDLAILDVSMPRMTGPPGGARSSSAQSPSCAS